MHTFMLFAVTNSFSRHNFACLNTSACCVANIGVKERNDTVSYPPSPSKEDSCHAATVTSVCATYRFRKSDPMKEEMK